eukprot:10042696-Prorocentrum_lima.AAC.1
MAHIRERALVAGTRWHMTKSYTYLGVQPERQGIIREELTIKRQYVRKILAAASNPERSNKEAKMERADSNSNTIFTMWGRKPARTNRKRKDR